MCLWAVLVSSQSPHFCKTIRSLGFKWQFTRISCDCSSLKRRVESGSNVSRRKEQVFSHFTLFKVTERFHFFAVLFNLLYIPCVHACVRSPFHGTRRSRQRWISPDSQRLQIARIFHLCVNDYLKSTIKLCPQIGSLFYDVTSKDVRKGRQKKQKIPKTP